METTYKTNITEVADIVNQYGPEYLEKHRLCPEQQKAYQAIINCRTSFMGGHLQECDQCGHQRPAYNSCRNRHCPTLLRRSGYAKAKSVNTSSKYNGWISSNHCCLPHGTFTWFLPFRLNYIRYFISTKGYVITCYSKLHQQL